MKPVLIKNDIYWLGVHDPALDAFEVVLPTPWGTTYNSYLIMAEKAALVEGVKVNFREEYVEKLKSLINPLDIKYVILNHTEADHSGAVPWIVEVAPNAQVITSEAASRHIHQLFHLERAVAGVADGDTLDLGDRELTFISAPFLHWPDTMFTYSPTDRVLFTCDAFGVHYCDEGAVFDDETGPFDDAYKYYFDNIMRPFKDKVLAALDKIKDLDVEIICTGHGPVLRSDPAKYFRLYREWSEEPEDPGRKEVAVFYSAAFGNVAQMADQLARGLAAAGARPVLRDIGGFEAGGAGGAAALIADAAGILVGMPAFEGAAQSPLEGLVDVLSAANVGGKPAAAFGPFGTTGEEVQKIEKRLKELGAKLVYPALAVDFAPDEGVFQKCRQFGRDFAAALV
jgi:flavorubredoxin